MSSITINLGCLFAFFKRPPHFSVRPISALNRFLRDVGESTFPFFDCSFWQFEQMVDTTVLIPSEEKKNAKNSTYWIYMSSLVISVIAIILGISGFMKKVGP